MRIGIIGTGNMGTVLVETLLDGKAASEEAVAITNRTMEKARPLLAKYPRLTYYPTVEELIKNSEVIFLCVKQIDLITILEKYKSLFTPNQCLISIASTITTEQMEKWLPASCLRLIPSITNRTLKGTFLLTFGEKCNPDWKTTIWNMFSKVGNPIEVDDARVRIAADIASCGPAFFSYLLQKFIEAAVKQTAIDEELASTLGSNMLIGMARLLEGNYYSLQELQEKVLVKGGITGEGIKVLEEAQVNKTFEKIFAATEQKFQKDIGEVKKYFQDG